MTPQDDPTPEEVERLNLESLVEEEEKRLQSNKENAKKKGLQHIPGTGYVDEKGTVLFDEDGREM